jgi:hypothetical protein
MRPFVNWVMLRSRGSERRFGFGLITELRMRSLARRVTLPSEESGKHFGLGLIKENGKPVWEETPQEEGHSFRRYVYEIMR